MRILGIAGALISGINVYHKNYDFAVYFGLLSLGMFMESAAVVAVDKYIKYLTHK